MNLNVASYEDILSYSKERPDYLKNFMMLFAWAIDHHFKS